VAEAEGVGVKVEVEEAEAEEADLVASRATGPGMRFASCS